jgi:hypothetical protein
MDHSLQTYSSRYILRAKTRQTIGSVSETARVQTFRNRATISRGSGYLEHNESLRPLQIPPTIKAEETLDLLKVEAAAVARFLRSRSHTSWSTASGFKNGDRGPTAADVLSRPVPSRRRATSPRQGNVARQGRLATDGSSVRVGYGLLLGRVQRVGRCLVFFGQRLQLLGVLNESPPRRTVHHGLRLHTAKLGAQ